MTRDERALLGAILADPGADLPRLVYADWLEERGGTAECDGCGGTGRSWSFPEPQTRCVPCSGTGRVPDGRPARAEFIRLDIERWRRWPDLAHESEEDRKRKYPDDWREIDRIEARLRELCPDEVSERWFPTPAGMRSSDLLVRRGFIESVSGTLATLFGGECGACSGVGVQGVVHHTREGGLVNAGDRTCPACSGTGRTAGVAGQLFGSQPVTSVTLVGMEPYAVEGAGGRCAWFPRREYPRIRGSDPDVNVLPDELFDLMTGETVYRESLPLTSDHDICRFSSRELALSALNAAAVSYGRSLAAGWTHRVAYDGCAFLKPGASLRADCPDCSGTGTRLRPGLPPLG